MAKIRALITIVQGKGRTAAPGEICETSEAEAKRLVSLGFAENLKNTEAKNAEPDGNRGKQPVLQAGQAGDV